MKMLLVALLLITWAGSISPLDQPALADQTSSGQAAQAGPGFSSLPIARRRAIENRLEPPPTARRAAPYSTPMYYLLARGYRDGVGSMDPTPAGNLILDRNRPDWQETILRDWVELGLISSALHHRNCRNSLTSSSVALSHIRGSNSATRTR